MADGGYCMLVISEQYADGYAPVVHVGEDVAIPIRDAGHAHAYAARVVEAAERAVYDQAVFQQIHILSSGEERAAAALLAVLRAARPVLDDAATDPLRFEPVLLSSKEAEVRVYLRGEPIFSLEPEAAVGHAAGVLRAQAVSQLDLQYRRIVADYYRSGDNRAVQVVSDLARYRAGGK